MLPASLSTALRHRLYPVHGVQGRERAAGSERVRLLSVSLL